MIFLPNSFERYAASLRLYLQISVLRDGEQTKHLKMLKRITRAEALYYKAESSPVDIIKLANSLLGAAIIVMLQRDKRLAASFSGRGVYLINKKLYTALLMELASLNTGNTEINIKADNSGVIIKASGYQRLGKLPIIIKAMKGTYFRHLNGNKLIINIPCEKTELDPQPVENEWCYILDRFSPVNVYLENVNNDSFQ